MKLYSDHEIISPLQPIISVCVSVDEFVNSTVKHSGRDVVCMLQPQTLQYD